MKRPALRSRSAAGATGTHRLPRPARFQHRPPVYRDGCARGQTQPRRAAQVPASRSQGQRGAAHAALRAQLQAPRGARSWRGASAGGVHPSVSRSCGTATEEARDGSCCGRARAQHEATKAGGGSRLHELALSRTPRARTRPAGKQLRSLSIILKAVLQKHPQCMTSARKAPARGVIRRAHGSARIPQPVARFSAAARAASPAAAACARPAPASPRHAAGSFRTAAPARRAARWLRLPRGTPPQEWQR